MPNVPQSAMETEIKQENRDKEEAEPEMLPRRETLQEEKLVLRRGGWHHHNMDFYRQNVMISRIEGPLNTHLNISKLQL